MRNELLAYLPKRITVFYGFLKGSVLYLIAVSYNNVIGINHITSMIVENDNDEINIKSIRKNAKNRKMR